MIIIILWVSLFSVIYFLVMKKVGLLRVPLLEEVIGLDVAEMGSRIKVQMKIAEGIVRRASLKFHEINSPHSKREREQIESELAKIKPIETARTD